MRVNLLVKCPVPAWGQRLSVTLHLTIARRIRARARLDYFARWPLPGPSPLGPDRNFYRWTPFSSMPEVENSLNTP